MNSHVEKINFFDFVPKNECFSGRESFKKGIKSKLFFVKQRSLKDFMSAQFLPSILVPLVGLVFPAVAMASLFLYIEKEEIQ